MTGSKNFIGRVAVVERAGQSVRILLHEGETIYAARDILAACGFKYPTKWCQREAQAESSVKLIKLPYPVNGKDGGASRKSVPMYFVSEECGRMILDMVDCDKGVRSWLEKEVFSYKIEPVKPVAAAAAPQALKGTTTRDDYLNKRIDALLFDLLELKKYIAQPNA